VGAAVVVTGSAGSGVVTGPNRVLAFHDLPHGWVPGIPRDVRRVSRIVGHLGGHTVAAAPTRNGNYCEAFWAKGGRGSWAGCVPRGPYKGERGDFHGYLIRASTNVTSTKVLAVSGSTLAGPRPHLYVVYADGARERLKVSWVTTPIKAGFFYRWIPNEHLSELRRAKSLELRDGGRLIARLKIRLLP
jgi:hypothetical protein